MQLPLPAAGACYQMSKHPRRLPIRSAAAHTNKLNGLPINVRKHCLPTDDFVMLELLSFVHIYYSYPQRRRWKTLCCCEKATLRGQRLDTCRMTDIRERALHGNNTVMCNNDESKSRQVRFWVVRSHTAAASRGAAGQSSGGSANPVRCASARRGDKL